MNANALVRKDLHLLGLDKGRDNSSIQPCQDDFEVLGAFRRCLGVSHHLSSFGNAIGPYEWESNRMDCQTDVDECRMNTLKNHTAVTHATIHAFYE